MAYRTASFLIALLLAATVAAQNMPNGVTPRVMLTMFPDSKKELKITKAQDKLIQERMKQLNEEAKLGRIPAGFNLMDGLDIPLDDILEEPQRVRLEELFVQKNGGFALSDAKIAEALQLTADQKASVRSLRAEYSAAMLEKMRSAPSNSTMKELEKLLAEAKQKALAVLVPEQAAQFEKMKGKPFPFKK